MVLVIIVIALVLAITAFQTLFGLFSGIINLFCAIVSVAITFGFWVPLTAFLAEQGIHPAYAEPAVFAGLFIISMLGLRSAADALFRGNVNVPRPLDVGGSLVLGFLSALIYVGMLVNGLLMLPWGEGRVMMYSRIERTEDRGPQGYTEFQTNHASFFRPDEFTAGLASMLSAGSLSGPTTFERVYPDFPEWVAWTGNTVQTASSPTPYRDEDGDGFEEGLAVEGWRWYEEPVEGWYRAEKPTRERGKPNLEAKTYRPEQNDKLLKVRLDLKAAAADRGENSAMHLFRPTMIRVVGTVGEKTRQFRARVVAGADPDVRGAPRIADPDTNFSLPASGATKIDAYFEVPEGFEPQFVEYRRHARAPLTAANLQEEAFAALEPLKSEADREAERRIGREGFMGIVTMSRKEDRLPLRVAPQLAANSANVSGETLVSGRLSGSARQLEADRAAGSVQEFAAPEDMSVIQVRFRPYQARSLAGQVFNFVGSTLNQYYAEDTTGQRYPLRGYFATVRRGNERHVEIYYAGPPDSPEGAAFRGMLDFKYIEMRELRSAQSEAELGLVFLVPPGKQITKVVNQQGAGYDIRNIGT